jgi:hypothetical protein
MRTIAIILLALGTSPIFASDLPTNSSNLDGEDIASLGERSQAFRNDVQFTPSLPKGRRSELNRSIYENSCYTMHSLIVHQPDEGSDSVRAQGERTCTAAARFKLKLATPENATESRHTPK